MYIDHLKHPHLILIHYGFTFVGQILCIAAAAITVSLRAVVVMDCRKAFIDRAIHPFTHTDLCIHCALRKGQTELSLIHYGHSPCSRHLSQSRGTH